MKFVLIPIYLLLCFVACYGQEETGKFTKNVSYNNVNVSVIIDKPAQKEVDVLVVYHGTAKLDSKILAAANTTLDNFKRILHKKDMMIVSVAYPEENLLLGDNIIYAAAALLWVKHRADSALGIKVRKIFLAGHSQGGYLVTRLNTMYATNGVIANAPGPLDLVYRCQLEDDGKVVKGAVCTLLKSVYGTTANHPTAYQERSLLNFTKGFKSDILFVQGLEDSPVQMHSWDNFKQSVIACSDCAKTEFKELKGFGHTALFKSVEAQMVFNDFINNR